MSNVYFTSDWHLGHRGILNWRPEFKSLHDMQECIIENMNEIIRPKDVLYCLGDMAFDYVSLLQIMRVNGRKILVGGNHDAHSTTAEQQLEVFEEIHGAVKYKKMWLTHIPIHPNELYRGKNIHGHVHPEAPAIDNDPNYFNVVIERNSYRPVSLDHIRQVFNTC